MMAAALARGTTYIENAALEPEVVDLAGFINCMGGRVSSAGSNVIKVEGVDSLAGTTYTPIPDRIEAGTYMVAAAASGGDVIINNVIPEHLKATTAKLIESGAQVEEQADAIHVSRWQETCIASACSSTCLTRDSPPICKPNLWLIYAQPGAAAS